MEQIVRKCKKVMKKEFVHLLLPGTYSIGLKISYDCRTMFKKILFVFLFIINAAFAGFPSPVKSANIRVVYIVDMFENEVVDTEMPRSVLDSILLDVDSVFFAPLGACDCACAGGDIFFYLSKKKDIRAIFKANFPDRICSKASDSLDLVLRLKDDRKIKALEEKLLKLESRSPTKKIEDDDDDVDDSRLIFILDSTVKAQKNKGKLKK